MTVKSQLMENLAWVNLRWSSQIYPSIPDNFLLTSLFQIFWNVSWQFHLKFDKWDKKSNDDITSSTFSVTISLSVKPAELLWITNYNPYIDYNQIKHMSEDLSLLQIGSSWLGVGWSLIQLHSVCGRVLMTLKMTTITLIVIMITLINDHLILKTQAGKN